MGVESILILFFVTKHLIFDWWMQTAWMAFNKHKLNHWGGYVHAGVNVLGTVIAIVMFAVFTGNPLSSDLTLGIYWLLIGGEFVSHFVMDYIKMNVTKWRKWDMTKDPQFWHWTGFDQWVHVAYLVFMAGIMV